jgi:adenylylsulfate kinase
MATGDVIWLTGLPSSGKTTIGRAVADRLIGERPVQLLDGDELRAAIGGGLGFSRADREENVRRIGYVADLLSKHGVTVVCPVISPFRSSREELRTLLGPRFVEVYVSTPVDVCADRDVKGLYAKQRAGEISHLTGVDDPYEAPLAPDLEIPTHEVPLADAVERIVSFVSTRTQSGVPS